MIKRVTWSSRFDCKSPIVVREEVVVRDHPQAPLLLFLSHAVIKKRRTFVLSNLFCVFAQVTRNCTVLASGDEPQLAFFVEETRREKEKFQAKAQGDLSIYPPVDMAPSSVITPSDREREKKSFFIYINKRNLSSTLAHRGFFFSAATPPFFICGNYPKMDTKWFALFVSITTRGNYM